MLSERGVNEFAERGYTVVEDFFSPDECEEVFGYAETAFEMPVGDADDTPLSYRPMGHLMRDELVGWACNERWAEPVARLVGPDARLYWEQFVTKLPGSVADVPWHQDNGYSPVEPKEYLTCWLAIDDATLDNGCLWVLPGSHRNGTSKHHLEGDFFRVGYEGPEPGTPLPLRRGSLLLFSSLMMHRSGHNLTDAARRAWIVQFCPLHATHGLTGRPFTDRLVVARDGQWLATPVREERFDFANING